MSLNIDIVNVNNAAGLDEFTPVTGEWRVNHADDRDEITTLAVEESIRNWMDSEHPLTVQVFHPDGRAIASDCPWSGTFVCSRER